MFARKFPKDTPRLHWTNHVVRKMQFYGISESKIKSIIEHPKRKEEGIAPDTVAVMCPTQTKKPQEIWVMYTTNSKLDQRAHGEDKKLEKKLWKLRPFQKKITIISAWRYPGVSPVRGKIPIPQDILEELQEEGIKEFTWK